MKYTLLKNKQTGERRVRINKSGEIINELDNPAEYNRLRKLALKNSDRSFKNEIMASMGLVKVKGSVSGKTYWE